MSHMRIAALVLGLTVAVAVAPLAAQNRPNTRDGLWLNVGVAGGSLGVGSWSDRGTGISAQISAGTTYSSRVLLGVSSNVWFRSEHGENLNITSLMGVVRVYPSESGAFLIGGVGGARSQLGPGDIIVDDVAFQSVGAGASQDVRYDRSENGSAFLLGIGNDLRVGENVSITPFLNGIFYRRHHQNANLVQVGVGLTWH